MSLMILRLKLLKVKNKKELKLIHETLDDGFVLTNTGWKFLRRPGAVRLAVGGLLSNQLVAVAAVICDSTTERVAFASVPSVSGICWLPAGARLAGDVRAVPVEWK